MCKSAKQTGECFFKHLPSLNRTCFCSSSSSRLTSDCDPVGGPELRWLSCVWATVLLNKLVKFIWLRHCCCLHDFRTSYLFIYLGLSWPTDFHLNPVSSSCPYIWFGLSACVFMSLVFCQFMDICLLSNGWWDCVRSFCSYVRLLTWLTSGFGDVT